MFLKEERLQAILEHARGIEGVDAEALKRMLDIARLIDRTDEAVDAYLAHQGLRRTHFLILQAIFHHPDRALSPAELADEVGITRASMTSGLDGLVKAGLVVRDRVHRDRRRVTVTLTDPGHAFIEEFLPGHYRRFCGITARLSTEEQEEFIRMYGILADGVSELAAE